MHIAVVTAWIGSSGDVNTIFEYGDRSDLGLIARLTAAHSFRRRTTRIRTQSETYVECTRPAYARLVKYQTKSRQNAVVKGDKTDDSRAAAASGEEMINIFRLKCKTKNTHSDRRTRISKYKSCAKMLLRSRDRLQIKDDFAGARHETSRRFIGGPFEITLNKKELKKK